MVGWFAMAGSGFGSGLIILHDEEFWLHPPPFVPPLPHPPPRPNPPSAWLPLELNFDHAIKERSSKNPFEGLRFPSLKTDQELGLNDILKNIEDD